MKSDLNKRKVRLTLYFVRPSSKMYSDNIMIYKPCGSIKRAYGLDELNSKKIYTVNDLIKYAKRHDAEINQCLGNCIVFFTGDSLYVKRKDHLLGVDGGMKISWITDHFNLTQVELLFFLSLGGASIHLENGFSFVIHTNEAAHKYSPHVHVVKDGYRPRYSLKTLERYKGDRCSQAIIKAEKKIIRPILIKNQKKFMDYWNSYMYGFTPPVEDEEGKQHYFL